jgi:hypothetical protein
MGKRDIGRRETKKAKKGSKKPSVSEILPTPLTIEVIKKKKKESSAEEE